MKEQFFASASMRVLARSENRVAVMVSGLTEPLILNERIFNLLLQTRQFRTVQEHVAHCEKSVGVPDAHLEMESEISTLISRRLLQAPCESFFTCDAAPEEIPRIDAVGIVTKNRPKSLMRCIDSVVLSLEKYHRSPEVRIYDDSGRDDSFQAIKDYVGSHPAVPILYAGNNEKKRYVQKLAKRTGISADIIEFCFFGSPEDGPCYGANQNAVLADSRGQLVLTVDDDVVFRLAPAPGNQRQLKLSANYDPTSLRLFATRDEAIASVDLNIGDVVGIHEGLLGRKVRACITDGQIDFRGATHGLNSIADPTSSIVSVTTSGLVGDSGFQDCTWLHVEGEAQQQLLKSETSYRQLRDTPYIVRFPECTILSEGQFFMTTMAGLDHRSFLPPFFPVYRNQDGIFGAMLRTCSPMSLIGHVPWLVVHDPLPEYSSPRRAAVRGPRFADLILSVVRECKLQSCDFRPHRRLEKIGEELIGLANQNNFSSWLRSVCARHWAADLFWHENLLKKKISAPAWWQADIRENVQKLERAFSQNCGIFEIGLAADDELFIQKVRSIFGRYGRLLQNWNYLIDECHDLGRIGCQLAEPVKAGNFVAVPGGIDWSPQGV